MAISNLARSLAVALALTAPMFGHAAVQYPSQPIKMIVPFPAGGQGIDMVSRTISKRLSEITGQSAVVDNRPGAGTIIGSSMVAKAPNDGYTLLVMANSFTVNPSIQSDLPYDTRADFAPVALLTITPHVLVARKALPVNELKSLIELGKEKPGSITYASIGNGTSPHLAGEMLKKLAGVNFVHVPYKGTPLAITALLGEHVDLLFGNLPDVLPYIQDGRLKPIAISATQRHASMPDVPTMGEAGFPEFESNSWYGIVAPAGTSPEVIGQLNTLLVQILSEKPIRDSFAERGLDVIASTPEEFQAWLNKEIDKYAQVIKDSGAHID
ncbi:Bug family tripartite tricarboxylate transporter substrate binding protein [Allopusillimonas ginsengisoli]|uniref:Bug family tripartite tricarboxylate transporter substrate binding protein n=1 Tax=Allopusillimonas ginsengisoli TaxID=453575 RepID=UPI0014302B2E|nr:tripartite tricarboxylate transporter substrate binding protein [Allopusillimonas ginsengisoli]